MKKINMVDLSTQYQNIKSEVDQQIAEVLESTAFIKGPKVDAFEKDLASYLGVKHVIGCANGTDALQVALMALGLKPGDEVITTNFTFLATVEVIALLGLTPVLVDCEKDSFNISVEAIKKNIGPKTKAIIPVHLFGQCADMEPILKLAEEHNLFIVEDNAQAIGAEYTFSDGRKAKSGTMGHIGCTSFFPSKNLGCYGDGGAIFTNDDALADQLHMVVNHGMKKRYYHEVVGVNSRLDAIQAAVLNVKLPLLDQYNNARRAAADYYDTQFKNCEALETPLRSAFSTHVFHQYTLKLKNGNREALIAYLNEQGIPAMIYYPVPLHKQEAYKDISKFQEHAFPVTETLSDEVFSLPMHTELEEEQLAYITSHVIKFLNQ